MTCIESIVLHCRAEDDGVIAVRSGDTNDAFAEGMR